MAYALPVSNTTKEHSGISEGAIFGIGFYNIYERFSVFFKKRFSVLIASLISKMIQKNLSLTCAKKN
jgi:hypothetical protein